MRLMPVMTMLFGTAMIAVPFFAERAGLLGDVTLEGARGSTAAVRVTPGADGPGGSLAQTLAATVSGAKGAFAALMSHDLGQSGDPSMTISAADTGSPAQSLAMACKIAAAQGGMGEADCNAKLGGPGGLDAMLKGGGLSPGAGGVAPPAALAPRIAARSGASTRASAGGAKFVKVQK